MMTLGLRLSSHTPFHADADDSELLLETLAVSCRRFHDLCLKTTVRDTKVLCAPKLPEHDPSIGSKDSLAYGSITVALMLS